MGQCTRPASCPILLNIRWGSSAQVSQAPALPQEPDPDSLDPEDEKRYVREKIIWETYQQLVSEARELSIPILNQNRFLTMVGYYQR